MAWIDEHIGEERITKNGQKAKIIDGMTRSLTIQFEDGTIVSGRTYDNFKKGTVRNPNYTWINKHLGKEQVMCNGQKAKIIAGASEDLTVQFEDGTIVSGRTYDNFRKGTIKNPNYTWINKHLGEERTMNNGQKAKIIGGRSEDLTVQFEDGTIVSNKTYGSFIIGSIGNPNNTWSSKHLGEERVMNNGQRAKIIGCTSSKDLTVQFEDGTVVKNKTYGRFIIGSIGNPNHTWLSEHLDEERVMNNGQKAKIIGGSYNSLELKFEDGTIVSNKTYKLFTEGRINKNSWVEEHVSEEHTMKNGLRLKIIGGRYNDLTVQFEDGAIVHHKTYDKMCDGNVVHPTLKITGRGVVKGSHLKSFNVNKLAFRNQTDKSVYYECRCRECGENGILTPQEMLKHECKQR